MKTLIPLLLLLQLFCYNQYERRDHNRQSRAKDVAIISALVNSCQNYPYANSVFSNSYYQSYSTDWTQYNKLVLGNSTEDIGCKTFPGWTSAGTGCFPTSGNTLYDMEKQLCVLNSKSPSFILIGTAGGNDLLRQVADDEIIARGKTLVNSLNNKYPSATKLLILVHATRVDYANVHRKITNPAIQSYAEEKGWKVISPDSCVALDPDGKTAAQSGLLDTIHPNQTTMQCIKSLALSTYNLTW